jgi:hypothetical protein
MKALAKKQRGIGLVGMIMIATAIIIVAILGMKVVPAYVHNMQVAQIFKSIARDPAMQGASIKDIKDLYSKRAGINYISDINTEDIEISNDGGVLRLSTSYSVRIPLVGNATLVLEFNPSSS